MKLPTGPLKRLVNTCFPPVSFPVDCRISGAFAYGSGAIKQSGGLSTPTSSQLDLLLIVRQSPKWHQINCQINPTHYSGAVRRFGNGKLIHTLTTRFFSDASVFYNTLIPLSREEFPDIPNTHYKYGVIDEQTAITDLNEWRNLYLSGRLHKPVLWIQKPEDKTFQRALFANEKAALAFVILDPSFSNPGGEFKLQDFYERIASISYEGDFRMKVGEDRKKISKLVSGSDRQNFFNELYLPHFKEKDYSSIVNVNEDRGLIKINSLNDEEILNLLKLLPKSLLAQGTKNESIDLYEAWQSWFYLNRSDAYDKLCKIVANQVYKSSVAQASLAICSTEPTKVVRYVSAKLRKMIKS